LAEKMLSMMVSTSTERALCVLCRVVPPWSISVVWGSVTAG
jgi:hypothetical protein